MNPRSPIDFEPAVEYGERALAIADRFGATTWGIHRVLGHLCQTHTWRQNFDRVELRTDRLERQSREVGHRA